MARRTESELKAQRDRGGVRADVTTLTVRQIVERFLLDPTVRQLRWLPDLSQLLAARADEYGSDRVSTLGRLQKAAYRDKLLAQKLSPARVNRYLAAFRRMWTWGLLNGYIMPSQTWPPGLFLKEPAAKEVLATETEVSAVFCACDDVDPALGILARFLVGTGARLSDALSVTWRDVDQANGDVAIRGQKTGRPFARGHACACKGGDPHSRPGQNVSGRVFWQYEHRMSPRSQWVRARKGFPKHLRDMRLHDCRHMCASLLSSQWRNRCGARSPTWACNPADGETLQPSPRGSSRRRS